MKDTIHSQAACETSLNWSDQSFILLLVPSIFAGKPLLRLLMSLYLICTAAWIQTRLLYRSNGMDRHPFLFVSRSQSAWLPKMFFCQNRHLNFPLHTFHFTLSTSPSLPEWVKKHNGLFPCTSLLPLSHQLRQEKAASSCHKYSRQQKSPGKDTSPANIRSAQLADSTLMMYMYQWTLLTAKC